MTVNVLKKGTTCPLCESVVDSINRSEFDRPALITWTCGMMSDRGYLPDRKQPPECRIRQLERQLKVCRDTLGEIHKTFKKHNKLVLLYHYEALGKN